MSKTDSKTRLRAEVRDRLAIVEKASRDGVDLFAQDIRSLYENEFMLADQLDRLDLRTATLLELVAEKLGITNAEYAERFAKIKLDKEARLAAAQAEEDAKAPAEEVAPDGLPADLPTDMPRELALVAAGTSQQEYPPGAFIYTGS